MWTRLSILSTRSPSGAGIASVAGDGVEADTVVGFRVGENTGIGGCFSLAVRGP